MHEVFIAVAGAASLAAFLAAYNAIGTAIVVSCSAALIVRRFYLVFIKKKPDPSNEFPTGRE